MSKIVKFKVIYFCNPYLMKGNLRKTARELGFKNSFY